MRKKLKRFTFQGVTQRVEYQASEVLQGGTKVDLYTFVGDPGKDLAIFITRKTPLQRVLKGKRTVEIYVSGAGKLTITKPDGERLVYQVGRYHCIELSVDVAIGDTMQWEAVPGCVIVGAEVCIPPYKPGRFKDLAY